jgi:flagellar basal-body rod modification protein FlgD
MASAVPATGSPAEAIFASLNQAREAQPKELSPQDRFLTLLVTQLRNQDPLNPMDNAQMTSQLAQISTVDGIEKLNTTLQSLVSGANEAQAMQAAALVGHGVLVPGTGLTLQDGFAFGGVELTEAADRVTVTITDGNGLVVRTLELGAREAGNFGFAWDGQADSGAAAAPGAYTMSVAAVRGEAAVSAATLQAAAVTGVVRTAQGVSLDLGAAGRFQMSDVRQIL